MCQRGSTIAPHFHLLRFLLLYVQQTSRKDLILDIHYLDELSLFSRWLTVVQVTPIIVCSIMSVFIVGAIELFSDELVQKLKKWGNNIELKKIIWCSLGQHASRIKTKYIFILSPVWCLPHLHSGIHFGLIQTY